MLVSLSRRKEFRCTLKVVAAVIRDNGHYLACRRSGNHELAGKWEFPGGKVEDNETDEIALTREIFEELGIEVIVEEFITKSSIPRGLGQIDMSTYFARLKTGRPSQSTDHDQLVWFTSKELSDLDWAQLDIPVVQAIQRLT